jgi:hypothetical protein
MNLRLVGPAVLSLVAALTSSSLSAQRSVGDTVIEKTLLRVAAHQPSDTLMIKTLPLQYLSNADAAKLISPYMPLFGTAGVYEAGSAVHAITVRAPAVVLARVDSLLKANDRAPVTVTLRLQVIAASDSAVRDASISELDAELRNLFRFSGYRLLSQNSVSVNDGSMFSATMRGPNGDQLTVTGDVTGVRRDGSKSVELHVSLSHNARQSEMVNGAVQTGTLHQQLLQTGLSIPIGQTVVVGSAMTTGSTPAIILTVRPELAQKP